MRRSPSTRRFSRPASYWRVKNYARIENPKAGPVLTSSAPLASGFIDSGSDGLAVSAENRRYPISPIGSIAMVIGAYAAISRELGLPLRFPGVDAAYDKLAQFTDAGLLARASVWAAETPKAGGEAFNVTNGDVFRWERMWEDVAGHFGLDVASPVPLILARHMADKGPLWREIAKKHGLIEPDLARLVGWGFGDFIFRTDSDVISDVNKIFNYGFADRMDSRLSLFGALDSLKRRNVLP